MYYTVLIYGTINFKKCTAVQKINFIYQISQVINVSLIPPPFFNRKPKQNETNTFLSLFQYPLESLQQAKQVQ